MPYKRGDVVLVLFPDSNLFTAKRRPALVVQDDNLNTGLAQTIVAMITSNLSRAGHPSRVTVLKSSLEGSRMGLLSDSVVMTDNLATVRDSEIDRAIGHSDDMDAINISLHHTLGLGKI
jgi:mRNA interferase MazF